MAFLGLLAGAAIGGLAGYAVGSWSHQPYYYYPYAPVYSPIPWHSPSYAAYAPTYPGYGSGYGYGSGLGYGSGYGYGSGLGYGSGYGFGSGFGHRYW